jgi:hypothetical protein
MMNTVDTFVFRWKIYTMREASTVQRWWELNWKVTELCGVFWVSSCDVRGSVKRAKVTDPLDQYTLLLVGMYKQW